MSVDSSNLGPGKFTFQQTKTLLTLKVLLIYKYSILKLVVESRTSTWNSKTPIRVFKDGLKIDKTDKFWYPTPNCLQYVEVARMVNQYVLLLFVRNPLDQHFWNLKAADNKTKVESGLD